MDSNSVMICIRWVCCRGDLDLAPLAVARDELACFRETLELLVHTLLFNAAFSLNERGLYAFSQSANISAFRARGL
jgi:hypothetical protein